MPVSNAKAAKIAIRFMGSVSGLGVSVRLDDATPGEVQAPEGSLASEPRAQAMALARLPSVCPHVWGPLSPRGAHYREPRAQATARHELQSLVGVMAPQIESRQTGRKAKPQFQICRASPS